MCIYVYVGGYLLYGFVLSRLRQHKQGLSSKRLYCLLPNINIDCNNAHESGVNYVICLLALESDL